MAPSVQIGDEQANFTQFSVKKPNVASAPNVPSAISQRPVATEVQSMGRAKDGRLLKIREYPKFDTLEEERVYRKQHWLLRFEFFVDRGFDEGIAGHISVRDPILTDHFCKQTLSMFMQSC